MTDAAVAGTGAPAVTGGRRVRREQLPGRWSGAHLPALDGLRGVAVVGVLAYHDRRLEGGFLGVDLFFTLSGFLITSLLVAEVHRSSRVALGAFWVRRARRLLPAFVALIGVLVLWGTFSTGTPWATSDLRGASLASLAYVANWYQAFAGGGYFDRFAAPSPLQHAWSLAIEEQFYVLFPLVVWACARRSRRPVRLLLVVCSLGWAASLAATLVLGAGGASPDRVYLGTDTRVGSILLGAVLACVLAIRPRRAAAAAATGPGAGERPAGSRRWTADAVAAGAVAVLAVLWATVDGEGAFVPRGGLTLHAVLVGVVIAVVVRVPASAVGRVLAWRPLVWLGTVSYGLYLWHWPVFLYVDLELDLDPLVATALKLVVSVALATVSLRLLERPLRRDGAAVLGGVVPTLAVVAVVVLGAALLPDPRPVTGAGPDLADAPRTLDDLEALPEIGGPAGATTSSTGPTTTRPPEADRPALVPDDEPLAAGVLERPGRIAGPPRLIVVGDSVPYFLGEALVPAQAEFGLVVANRALPACSAADPDGERVEGRDLPVPTDCTGKWAEDAAAFDPDVVVVSLNGDLGVELAYDGEWGNTCSSAYRDRLRGRLLERLPAFTARGARVFLLTPLLTQDLFFRTDDAADARRCMIEIQRAVAAELPGVSQVAFGEWVCPDPDGACRDELDGTPVRREDGVHFTGDGALLVWRLLLPDLLDAAGVT